MRQARERFLTRIVPQGEFLLMETKEFLGNTTKATNTLDGECTKDLTLIFLIFFQLSQNFPPFVLDLYDLSGRALTSNRYLRSF